MCFSIKKKERVSYFMSHDIDNDVSCLPLHIVLFSQKKKKNYILLIGQSLATQLVVALGYKLT